MASVLNMRRMHYALEKFTDFIRGSGSGAQSAYAAIYATGVIDSLCAFEEKLQAHGTPADDIEFYVGAALYAACQFQAYVTGNKSDIANQNVALVYRDFLETKIEKLHLLEQDMDSSAADNAIGGTLSSGFISQGLFKQQDQPHPRKDG